MYRRAQIKLLNKFAEFDGVLVQVEEMALNNVVLQQSNGIKVFYPITRMFSEPVYNVSRSSNRWEGYRVRIILFCGTSDHAFLQLCFPTACLASVMRPLSATP